MVVDTMPDSDNDKAAAQALVTKKWIAETCPAFGVYGESAEGKTLLAKSILDDDDYWPVLYIDYDEGGATLGGHGKNPKICDYRSKSKRPEGMEPLDWMANMLKLACTSKHKAIVFEGITRFRDDVVGAELLEQASTGSVGKKHNMKRAYIVASAYTKALFSLLSLIKDTRKRNGTGVLVLVTMNSAEHTTETTPHARYQIPNLSVKLAQDIMSRTDVFAEMSRDGSKSRLKVIRGGHNKLRKARGVEMAKKIENMRNPELPAIMTMWARTEQEQTNETLEWTTADDTVPEDETHDTVPEDETQDTDED